MNALRDKTLRMFVAGTFFWMVLVLTPRAWVGSVHTEESAEIPVRLLDQPDDCLWCEPAPAVQPANCTDEDTDEPMWLNPDESPQQDAPPCIERDTQKPSA